MGIFLAEGLIAFLPSDNPFPVGTTYLVFAIATIGISLTGFRTGAKWAWFAFLYTPIFFAVAGYEQLGSPFFPGAIVLGLVPCVVGLLLPYRKFFPKKVLSPFHLLPSKKSVLSHDAVLFQTGVISAG